MVCDVPVTSVRVPPGDQLTWYFVTVPEGAVQVRPSVLSPGVTTRFVGVPGAVSAELTVNGTDAPVSVPLPRSGDTVSVTVMHAR